MGKPVLIFPRPTAAVVTACLAAVLFGCAGARTVDRAGIKSGMDGVIRQVSRDRKSLASLKQKKVGAEGFFYVINSEGTVVYHPQQALVGSNLRKFGIADAITEKRSGCLSYALLGRQYLLFFEPLGREEFLCLSIPAAELSGPSPGCAPFRHEQDEEEEED